MPLPDGVEAALEHAVDALLGEGNDFVEAGEYDRVLDPLGPHHRVSMLPREVVALALLGLRPLFLVLAARTIRRNGKAEDDMQVVAGDDIEVIDGEETDHVLDPFLRLLVVSTLAEVRIEVRETSGWS